MNLSNLSVDQIISAMKLKAEAIRKKNPDSPAGWAWIEGDTMVKCRMNKGGAFEWATHASHQTKSSERRVRRILASNPPDQFTLHGLG